MRMPKGIQMSSRMKIRIRQRIRKRMKVRMRQWKIAGNAGLGSIWNMKDKNMETDKIRLLNPLNLAFIGDAVYESFVRQRVFHTHQNASPLILHRLCVSYVQAQSQSLCMGFVEERLDETELVFYKRGRNMKAGHAPKNAGITEYRRATGFECLLGYLQLSEQFDRLNEIMDFAAQIIEKELI